MSDPSASRTINHTVIPYHSTNADYGVLARKKCHPWSFALITLRTVPTKPRPISYSMISCDMESYWSDFTNKYNKLDELY